MKRHILPALALFIGLFILSSCSTTNHITPGDKSVSIKLNNADFYDADGKFDVEKGKDAVITLMKYHGYPVTEGLRERIWVSDYNTGQYTKLGLAAVMHKNNETDRYMLMDLFLMPGQMLPEHWHLSTQKNPAKMEGWLVRSGLSYIIGEGKANLPKEVVVPACHNNGKVTVDHCVTATPGVFVSLNRVKAHHWQFGGPEGAIITESANVHDNAGVRHLDKGINDFFLGK